MKYASLSDEELVKACAESRDPDAWEEFVRRFRKPIGLVIRRILSRRRITDPQLIDDLIQETFVKICANDYRVLRDFKPQHPDSFKNLVRVMGGNAARDYIRSLDTDKRPKIADVEISELEPFISDRNAPGAAQIEREIQINEIDQILVGNQSPTAARDRDIFWLHHRQGFTAAEIQQIKCFRSVKSVESVLFRLRWYVCQALAEQPADNPEGNRFENPLAKGEGQT